MVKNRNIIFFGEDWGRFPSTIQHIGKVFLKENRVMWIGSLGHRKPSLTLDDFIRAFGKIRNFFKKKTKESQTEVILVTPFIIPLHDYSIFRLLNNFLLKYQLKKAISNNNFDTPIIITATPVIGEVLGSFGETSSCYICQDDYSMFEGAFKSLLKLEEELLRRISCSFSVSDSLVKTRVPSTKRTFFLPQGVDAEHFVKNVDNIPTQLMNLKKPVIGFFGLVSSWIDLDLIVYCAEKLPNYTFLVIGRSSVDVSKLNSRENIKFIGEVPFSELPSYASIFDVGMISFVINELTIACNPLKLLEYLSLTIPVVSTDLPEVKKFEEDVIIAGNYDEFVQGIQRSLTLTDDSLSQRRREVAKKYSWKSIAENISTEILKFEEESLKK